MTYKSYVEHLERQIDDARDYRILKAAAKHLLQVRGECMRSSGGALALINDKAWNELLVALERLERKP